MVLSLFVIRTIVVYKCFSYHHSIATETVSYFRLHVLVLEALQGFKCHIFLCRDIFLVTSLFEHCIIILICVILFGLSKNLIAVKLISSTRHLVWESSVCQPCKNDQITSFELFLVDTHNLAF